MDREAWHAAVHGVERSRTRLSNWNELTEVVNRKFSELNFCSWDLSPLPEHGMGGSDEQWAGPFRAENAAQAFHPEPPPAAAGTLLRPNQRKQGSRHPHVWHAFFFFPSDIICANFDPTLKTDLRRNPKKAQFRILAISPTEVSPYMRGNQGSRAWSHLEDNLVSWCLQGSLNF